jgi:hypothetical protein
MMFKKLLNWWRWHHEVLPSFKGADGFTYRVIRDTKDVVIDCGSYKETTKANPTLFRVRREDKVFFDRWSTVAQAAQGAQKLAANGWWGDRSDKRWES